MAETYCGKSCGECTHKEALNCPGCKLGPGRYQIGDCEIAKCCRTSGHMSCDTCSHSRNYCATFNARNAMAQSRAQNQAREARKLEVAKNRSLVLGKWLWILFWLYIASNIVALFGNDLLGSLIPTAGLISSFVNLAISVAILVIFIKLGDQHSGYRTGGICMLVSSVMNLAPAIFGSVLEGTLLAFLLSIPTMVAGLLGTYKIYMAHSDTLNGMDDELSEKWCSLWKWHIILFCVTLGSIVVMLLAAMLGILMAMVGTIGTLVIDVLELVYLYKTAKTFRNYTDALAFAS